MNLPVTPITDLRIHKGNLIAATSGRAFWILDDLSVIRQYKKDAASFAIYRPENAYLVNGSSEMDQPTEPPEDEFTGANKFRGVNPATGVVVYYQLPELKKTDEISMEIKDAAGNIVRSFSSKADEKYTKYDGAPKPEPLLPKAKGLNRFVWDMRYATMPGVPGVRIEGSYAGSPCRRSRIGAFTELTSNEGVWAGDPVHRLMQPFARRGIEPRWRTSTSTFAPTA